MGDFVKRFALAVALVSVGYSLSYAATPAPAPQPSNPAQINCSQVQNPAARKTCEAGRAEFVKGNYRLSLALMRKALAASPNEGIVRVQIARILMQLDGRGPAERELRQARKDRAPDEAALPLLFAVMVSQHEERKLLNEFPEPASSAKDPVAAAIWRGRAVAFQSLDQFQEAATAMDRSLALNRNAGGLLVRAELATRQKDAALARKLVDEAYKLAPQESAVLLAKLDQLQKSNDAAGVLAVSDQMLKLYPLSVAAGAFRIEVFLKQNQDMKAKSEVDALMARRPKSPLGLYYRAVLLSRAKDRKGAAQTVQALPPEFVKQSPEHGVTIAQMLVDNGNIDSAAGVLGGALAANPDLTDARLMLATIRMRQNSPQSALLVLTPAKDSPDPRVRKMLGEIRARIAKDRAF
jgi:tetratricopeptide (TPR) repeat protein